MSLALKYKNRLTVLYFADTRFEVIHGHVADLLLETGQIHGAIGFDAVVSEKNKNPATAPKRKESIGGGTRRWVWRRESEGRRRRCDGADDQGGIAWIRSVIMLHCLSAWANPISVGAFGPQRRTRSRGSP